MILITGINGGIGNYLFNSFLKNNEDVLGVYHKNKPEGVQYKNCVQLDISSQDQIQLFIKKHSAQLSNITLVNCAGVSYNSFAHKSNLDDWKNVIDVNLTGTFNMIAAVLPLMREQNYGRIINLSSVVAQTGVIGTSAYAASKAGLNGMIKSIVLENAQKGITINNINLGYFSVGMINTVPVDVQQEIKNKIPIKEFGNPEDILNTVQYIQNTPYLNGTCIDLNGGLY